MVEGSNPKRVAWLEGRVEALEAALERRSLELRTLQKSLPKRELLRLHRLDSWLRDVPVTPFDPEFWDETPRHQLADVEDTLLALWSALASEAGKSQVRP